MKNIQKIGLKTTVLPYNIYIITKEDKDISHIDDILSMDFESIYHTLEDTEKRYLWQSIIDHIDIGNNRNDITIDFK